MNYKWTYNLNKSFRQILIILLGETVSVEIFVRRNYSSGEIFVTCQKIRNFRPTKFRPIRYHIFYAKSCLAVAKEIFNEYIGHFYTSPSLFTFSLAVFFEKPFKKPAVAKHFF